MYVIPIIFLFIVLFFIIIFHFKKRGIIKKISAMTFEERSELLNEIAAPFGYCYEPSQDIFSCRTDAWQREFGFRNAYDVAAPYASMVYDYQTIYFDYNGRTWLIELWKGQYGINTGCEIGIYHTDTIIPPEKYSSTLFDAVSDEEMLPFSVTLWKKGKCLGKLSKLHWWLTIFDMGMFSKPKSLAMEISITFPDCAMFNTFKKAAIYAMPSTRFSIYNHTISFIFAKSNNHYSLWKRFVRTFALIWCRLLLAIFCLVTRSFKRSGDKILYLYFYLPFVFRRTLRLHRLNKK